MGFQLDLSDEDKEIGEEIGQGLSSKKRENWGGERKRVINDEHQSRNNEV